MTAWNTVALPLKAQLKKLQERECESDACMAEQVSKAMDHYALNIKALNDQDPLASRFIELSRHLALRRLELFHKDVFGRTARLNQSQAVQDALHLLGRQHGLQCELSTDLQQEAIHSQEEWAQCITGAFLHLLKCSNSLQHQLTELLQGLEAGPPVHHPAKDAAPSDQHSINHACSSTWYTRMLGMTQILKKNTYSYTH
ncbi:hypothetical protein N5C12_18705 [Comamonas aquatica]|uniref:hypothetical protein n=1 Tax=Comamonas aquatica TaxID=225991 RepID=UPI002448A758|nr:hypothetical protein [Comamonas aquatica]MDH0901354.1 hypothetical protein [Comamonas aquatica]